MSKRPKRVCTGICPCPIIGSAKPLPENVLPTINDALQYFGKLFTESKSQKIRQNVILDNMVAERLIFFWKKSSIPSVSKVRVKLIFLKWQKKYKTLLKSYKRDHKTDSYKVKLSAFLKNASQLLDLARCKCVDLINCRCATDEKVQYNLNDTNWC